MYCPKMFSDHLQKLLYTQSRLVGTDLCKDYAIIYDYLMDILEKDHVVGPFLVRKKQQKEYINGDILLDFTKKFNIRSYVRDPFLCLTLQTEDNAYKNITPHPFFNENFILISKRITQGVWNALDNGFSKIGSFVRGHRDDIYDLTLSPKKFNDYYVKVYANSEDINLKINIRILIKHTKNFQNEPKPHPAHVLKREWLAMVPLRPHYLFDVCMPLLEKEIRNENILIVMLQRLLKHFFCQQKHLYKLNCCFLESAIYEEYLEFVRGKKEKFGIGYFFKGIIIHIQHRFNSDKFFNVFNTKLNLMKMFKTDYVHQRNISLQINEVRHQTDKMAQNHNLSFKDLIDYFDLKMESGLYQVDQFGIFNSF